MPNKKGVSESFPFDDVTLVLKVMNKIFAIISLDEKLRISLKCDPEKATYLREQYPSVLPGYHLNKLHWNTIIIDGSINANLIKEWINNSYQLITNKLPKVKKEEFNNL